MIKIRIGKKRYKGVYRWEDIPLKTFCDLATIEMPDGYEDYILIDGNFESEDTAKYVEAVSSLTPEQLTKSFPAYYRQVIECLTNIPKKVIDTLSRERVEHLYEYYFKPFVLSILYHAPVIHLMGNVVNYIPPDVKSFKVGLKRYWVPLTVNILGQEIPLAQESIITYTEASDVFRGMKVSRYDVQRLALFMAIYCRRFGKKYNDGEALENQDTMMKVPMSIVWSVFFYTVQRLSDSELIIQLFGNLPRMIEEVIEQVKGYKSTVPVESSMK